MLAYTWLSTHGAPCATRLRGEENRLATLTLQLFRHDVDAGRTVAWMAQLLTGVLTTAKRLLARNKAIMDCGVALRTQRTACFVATMAATDLNLVTHGVTQPWGRVFAILCG